MASRQPVLSHSALEQHDRMASSPEPPRSPGVLSTGSVFSTDSFQIIAQDIDHIKDLLNLSIPPKQSSMAAGAYGRDVFKRPARSTFSHYRIHQELDSLKDTLAGRRDPSVNRKPEPAQSANERRTRSSDYNANRIDDLTLQLELEARMAERDRAYQEAEDLRQQQHNSVSSLQTANRKILDLESSRAANLLSLREAHDHISRLEAQLNDFKAQIDSLNSSNQGYAWECQEAQRQITSLQAKKEELSESLNEANARLTSIEGFHSSSSKSLDDANVLIGFWEKRNGKSFQEVDQVEESKSVQMREMETRLSSLQNQHNETGMVLAALQNEHIKLQDTHGQLTKSLAASVSAKEEQKAYYESQLHTLSETHQATLKSMEDQHAFELASKSEEHESRMKEADARALELRNALEQDHKSIVSSKADELKRIQENLRTAISLEQKRSESKIVELNAAHEKANQEYEDQLRKLTRSNKFSEETKRDYDRRLSAAAASLEQQQTIRARELSELSERLNTREKELKNAKKEHEIKLKALWDERVSVDDQYSQNLQELESKLESQAVTHAGALEAVQKDFKTAKEKREEEHQRTIRDFLKRISHLETTHTAALDTAHAAHENAIKVLVDDHARNQSELEAKLSDRERSHESALKTMQDEYDAANRQLDKRHASELKAFEERMEEIHSKQSENLQERDTEHHNALQLLTDEHAEVVSNLHDRMKQFESSHATTIEEHEAAMASTKASHDTAIEQLHAEASALTLRFEKQLEDANASHESQMEALKKEHEETILSKNAQHSWQIKAHNAALAQLKNTHEAQLTSTTEEIEKLKAEHETETARLNEEIKSLRDQMSQQEHKLEALRASDASRQPKDVEAPETGASGADTGLAAKLKTVEAELVTPETQGVSEPTAVPREGVFQEGEQFSPDDIQAQSEVDSLKAYHEQSLKELQSEHEFKLAAISAEAEESKKVALEEAQTEHAKNMEDARRAFEQRLELEKQSHEQALAVAMKNGQENTALSAQTIRENVAAELDLKHRYALRQVETTYNALGAERERQLSEKIKQRYQEEVELLEGSWMEQNIQREQAARVSERNQVLAAHEEQLGALHRDHAAAIADKDERILHLESLSKRHETETAAAEEKAAFATANLAAIQHETDDQLTKSVHRLHNELESSITKRSELEAQLSILALQLAASQRDLNTRTGEKKNIEEQLTSLKSQVAGIRKGLEEKARTQVDAEIENKVLATRISSLRRDYEDAMQKRQLAEQARDALLAQPPSLLTERTASGAVEIQDRSLDSKGGNVSLLEVQQSQTDTSDKFAQVSAENERLKQTLEDLRIRFQKAQLSMATARMTERSPSPRTMKHRKRPGGIRPRPTIFETRLLTAQRELAQLGKTIATNEDLFSQRVDTHMKELRRAGAMLMLVNGNPSDHQHFESRLKSAQTELTELGTTISANEGVFATKILEHVKLLRLVEDSLTSEYREKFREMLFQKAKLEEDLAAKFNSGLLSATSALVSPSLSGAGSPELEQPAGITIPTIVGDVSDQPINDFQALVDEFSDRISRLTGDETLDKEADEAGTFMSITSVGSAEVSALPSPTSARRIEFAQTTEAPQLITLSPSSTGRSTRAISAVSQSTTRTRGGRNEHQRTFSDVSALSYGPALRTVVRSDRPLSDFSGNSLAPIPPDVPPKSPGKYYSRPQALPTMLQRDPSLPLPQLQPVRRSSMHTFGSGTYGSGARAIPANTRPSTQLAHITRSAKSSSRYSANKAFGGVSSRSSLALTSRGLVRTSSIANRQRKDVTCNFW